MTAAAGAFTFQRGHEGAGDAQRSQVVGAQVALEAGQVTGERAAEGQHARVVDQHGHVRRGRCRGRDASRVGDVEGQRPHPWIIAGDGRPGPGGGVHPGCSGVQQLTDQAGAQAAVSAGDQGNAVGEVHQCHLLS